MKDKERSDTSEGEKVVRESKRFKRNDQVTESSFAGLETKAQSSGSRPVLLLGSDDFEETVSRNSFYVDKTLMIRDILSIRNKVSVFLRPPRFGKSLNLSMIKSFFSNENESASKLFEKYAISKEHPDLVHQHCGKYPVVVIDFKECKANTWADMYQQIWNAISRMLDPFRDVLKEEIKQHRRADIDLTVQYPPKVESFSSMSLQWLTEQLFIRYKKRVIVLIDEYDTPLYSAIQNNYFDEAASYFEYFWSLGLKGNTALEFACMMGIPDVRCAGFLSVFNNAVTAVTYSVDTKSFSSYFGFSLEEINDHTGIDKETSEEIIKWHNGDQIGNKKMIHPWSCVSYLLTRGFGKYWVDTSSHWVVTQMLQSFPEICMSVLQLLEGENISVSDFDYRVNLVGREYWMEKTALRFLVLTGYLTYIKEDDYGVMIKIPNLELKQYWKEHVYQLIQQFAHRELEEQDREKLKNALLKFNIADIEAVMNKMIIRLSVYGNPSALKARTHENIYHAFFHGLFLSTLNSKDVKITANEERGQGWSGVCIDFKNESRAIILGLKRSDRKNNLEKDAVDGLEASMEKKYYEGLEGYSCLVISASFFRSFMSELKHKIVTLP